MGRAARPVPEGLAYKLYCIRKYLGLTQEQLIEQLQWKKTRLRTNHISEYENGKREPPMGVVLLYARLVRLPMDVLVDDYWELPSDMDYELNIEIERLSPMFKEREEESE